MILRIRSIVPAPSSFSRYACETASAKQRGIETTHLLSDPDTVLAGAGTVEPLCALDHAMDETLDLFVLLVVAEEKEGAARASSV